MRTFVGMLLHADQMVIINGPPVLASISATFVSLLAQWLSMLMLPTSFAPHSKPTSVTASSVI